MKDSVFALLLWFTVLILSDSGYAFHTACKAIASLPFTNKQSSNIPYMNAYKGLTSIEKSSSVVNTPHKRSLKKLFFTFAIKYSEDSLSKVNAICAKFTKHPNNSRGSTKCQTTTTNSKKIMSQMFGKNSSLQPIPLKTTQAQNKSTDGDARYQITYGISSKEKNTNNNLTQDCLPNNKESTDLPPPEVFLCSRRQVVEAKDIDKKDYKRLFDIAPPVQNLYDITSDRSKSPSDDSEYVPMNQETTPGSREEIDHTYTKISDVVNNSQIDHEPIIVPESIYEEIGDYSPEVKLDSSKSTEREDPYQTAPPADQLYRAPSNLPVPPRLSENVSDYRFCNPFSNLYENIDEYPPEEYPPEESPYDHLVGTPPSPTYNQTYWIKKNRNK
ncbi:MAG: hypothetical protein OXE99_00310 [Cellvibrionales bacterium]|nr:hypothetical protein [Cellvibrionales bacterium]